MVTLTGSETLPVKGLSYNDLQISPEKSCAESGALPAKTDENSPATVQAAPSPLTAIAQALANLSADDRAKLAAMLVQGNDGKGRNT
jgi:hypothetical protein